MPQRGVKPVLQFRGRIRQMLQQTVHYLNVLLAFDAKGPGQQLYTPAVRLLITQAKNINLLLIQQKTNV